MVQVEKVRITQLNLDVRAAVHRELQHRSVELPVQLVGDADLRAVGTIKALDSHDLHPWRVEPAPEEGPYRHDHSAGSSCRQPVLPDGTFCMAWSRGCRWG